MLRSKGIKISENEVGGDDETTIAVKLLKNKRGQKMEQAKTVVVKKSEVKQLTSVDMINSHVHRRCGGSRG